MKHLLIIIVVALLFCSGCEYITDKEPMIIDSVKLVNNNYGKYKYTTRDMLNKIIIYSDKVFLIGDTIQISKKSDNKQKGGYKKFKGDYFRS